MSSELRFDGKVVIITGAGQGLGRSHALLFGSRGAKVVVNDLGGDRHGGGKDSKAADRVVDEIKAAGGQAVANYDSVENGAGIVKTAVDAFGRVDIVVNNAGILRDSSFAKMTQDDWDLIYRVHVLGAFRVTHAAWPYLKDAGAGRVIFTASSAGIYGNFGQANYAMAKLGLVGFSQTLAAEGRKAKINVNTIAPFAGSRLTETILPKEIVDALKPEYVSPLVAWLCHESCTESSGLFEVGAGLVSKLRWERTQGKTFGIGRPIAPEAMKSAWSQITDFSKSTHPADINEAAQPFMANLTKPSRGGNEYIDVDEALAAQLEPLESSYEARDLALYALGVGAGRDPLSPKDLRYVYELNNDGFIGLPTYAVVPAVNAILSAAMKGQQVPGLRYGLDRVLHGEQYTEVRRPLPAKAQLVHKMKVKDIWDKGKNAIVVTAITTEDKSTGEELFYNEVSTVIRGVGGWGGERGPVSDANSPPDRAPDAVVTEKTSDNQALLYRLSGDWNPLHADPGFAQAFGYPKPILHGLCTFGYVGRHAIQSFAKDGDARYFKNIRVRFADIVFPGETLKTEIWKMSPTHLIVRASVVEREKVVISNASVDFYTEIPTAVAKPKTAASPGAAAASSGPATLLSRDIFTGIRAYVASQPDLAKKIGTIFQFRLSGPDSTWTLNLKDGGGAVEEGETSKPDCTLALSDADFMEMSTGKANPQKLYFGGKLKITGNVMASQKLEFLKKIDPKLAIDAMAARGGGAAGGAPSAAAAPAAASTLTTGDIFHGIRAFVASQPDLAKKIGTIFQFKLSGPDSTWTLNLKDGAGAVEAGETVKPDCTLALSDADFMEMSTGKADPQKLYFGGKLKISGNVMASQKLEFLKKVDPKLALDAMAARAAGGGSSSPQAKASPAASARSAQAKAIFGALSDRLAKESALAKEVGASMVFRVLEPQGTWTVDLRSSPGKVTEGESAGAAATFTLTDEDLVTLCRAEETVQALFMKGRLRVDGQVAMAQRLGFLKKLA